MALERVTPCVGYRSKIRVTARLVIVGVKVKRDEVGVVVKTSNGSSSPEPKPVTGIDFVAVVTGIVSREGAIQT